jgi:hypothetical protein
MYLVIVYNFYIESYPELAGPRTVEKASYRYYVTSPSRLDISYSFEITWREKVVNNRVNMIIAAFVCDFDVEVRRKSICLLLWHEQCLQTAQRTECNVHMLLWHEGPDNELIQVGVGGGAALAGGGREGGGRMALAEGGGGRGRGIPSIC